MWIVLAIVALIIVLIVLFSKNVNKSRKRFRQLGALHLYVMKHKSGLPAPTDLELMMFVCHDKIVLERGKHSFEIANERIRSYNINPSSKFLVNINYVDRNGNFQFISLESKVLDLNLFVSQCTKALGRPEDATVITENGSVSL
jgi:hypothetical protein